MDNKKAQRLAEMGGYDTTVRDFFGLSDEEMVIVEMRVRLTEALIAARKKAKLTQAEVAKRIQSSQSRIAKMEGGDSQTSLELLVRAITAVGGEVVLTVKPSTGTELARKLREMRQKPRETKRAAIGSSRAGIARHA